MKKILLSAIAATALIFSLASCGTKEGGPGAPGDLPFNDEQPWNDDSSSDGNGGSTGGSSGGLATAPAPTTFPIRSPATSDTKKILVTNSYKLASGMAGKKLKINAYAINADGSIDTVNNNPYMTVYKYANGSWDRGTDISDSDNDSMCSFEVTVAAGTEYYYVTKWISGDDYMLSELIKVECGTTATAKIGQLVYGVSSGNSISGVTDPKTASPQTLTGGVPYGIVIDTDASGNPTKFVSVFGSADTLAWISSTAYNSYKNEIMNFNVSTTDGSINTNAYYNASFGNVAFNDSTYFPALYYTKNIKTRAMNHPLFGYSTWYVPARDEVTQIAINATVINAAIKSVYTNFNYDDQQLYKAEIFNGEGNTYGATYPSVCSSSYYANGGAMWRGSRTSDGKYEMVYEQISDSTKSAVFLVSKYTTN